jgi:ATP-dependent Clp protease adaptor protein ClpS
MTTTQPAPAETTAPPRFQKWNVVLFNDNDHSVEYVIRMMKELFGHPPEDGMRIAVEVHYQGRAVVLTTHKEHAELKRDQIHAYGKDPTVHSSKGSMSSIIEPAD